MGVFDGEFRVHWRRRADIQQRVTGFDRRVNSWTCAVSFYFLAS
jgi:hypothetical protein